MCFGTSSESGRTDRRSWCSIAASSFIALALYALWQRQTLRLRASELSQVVLGFAIPLLLVRHVVTTRISDSFLHTDVGYYAYLLWVYFVRSPECAPACSRYSQAATMSPMG